MVRSVREKLLGAKSEVHYTRVGGQGEVLEEVGDTFDEIGD